MNKILIVEADFRVSERMFRSFADLQIMVRSCGTLETAVSLLEREKYQMLILDAELPGGDGYDIIHKLGIGIYDPARPAIILMVPNSRIPELSELYERGIADYITKPFNTAVLKAKVLTQFARLKKNYNLIASERFEAIGAGSAISIVGEHRVVIDDYVFDFDAREYSAAGRKVRLDRIEQCLLRNLVENKGIVLKKKALMEKLRSESRVSVDEGALAQAVQTLTEKLDAQDYIKKVYAIGYIWILAEEKQQ